MRALEPGDWLAHLPEVGVPALATLRALSCRYEPATAGELLSLLRSWAYDADRREPAVAWAVQVALETDWPGALALAERLVAERLAERGR